MRFSIVNIIAAALVASTAYAAPSDTLIVRGVAPAVARAPVPVAVPAVVAVAPRASTDVGVSKAQMVDTIQKAAASSCNFLECAAVLVASACLIGSIATDDPIAASFCITGGLGAACPCADCISGLETFLQNHGVCPSS